MTNKERYIEWANAQEYVPISMMPWWLDAVCAGRDWDVLLAEDEDGKICGAMPYLLRQRLWSKSIVMPPLSPVGGIWVNPETTADRWKTAEMCRKIKEQLDQMGLAYYYQEYLPGSLCVDAMRALGFKTKERVTYRVEDLSDLDAVINAFSRNKKRQLQKALSLHVDRSMDVEDFYRLYTTCQEGRKSKCAFTREFLLVLERKARRLGQCAILSVCNADGQPYAAVFLVWDKNYMYYLISSVDPAFTDSGCGALLALEAMKLAREKHVLIDFAASIEREGVKHYKQFASSPVTYFSVERSYRWWAFLIPWFA